MTHKCWWLCKVLCFLAVHRWDSPGGHCECCGKHDDFFDKEVDKERRKLRNGN